MFSCSVDQKKQKKARREGNIKRAIMQ